MAVTGKATKSANKKSKAEQAVKDAALQRHDKDTWSPEVQVLSLTKQILVLQEHVTINKKDFDAKRSLLKKVARRRTFLKYLKDTNLERYVVVSKQLDLKV